MNSIKDMVLIFKDVSHIVTDMVRYQTEQIKEVYKETLTRILVWVLVVLTAIMLALGGLGMILWGVFFKLALVIGPAGSAFILGLFLILLAVIIFLIARGTMKD